MKKFTEKEQAIILEALHYYLEEAKQNLKDNNVLMYNGTRRPIGIIERKLLEDRPKLVEPIIKKLEQ